jgi:hypothetical protein
MLNRITTAIVALASLSQIVACTRITARPLPHRSSERLIEFEHRPADAGEQIYEGQVYALDGRMDPLFRYERRVKETGSTLTSTHITYDPANAVVVVQSAVHSRDYELRRADLIHGQSGVTASVVIANGQATFTLDDGQHQTTSTEQSEVPFVAGPTMFGFIQKHWAELVGGASLPIRFAVLERGESIRFVLDTVSAPAGRTTVRMRPSSPLVRLAVGPTHFQFDAKTRQIVEYTGRVPPLEETGGRLATLDARVAYTFRTAEFR